MSNENNDSTFQRLDYLDSVRGIAAMMVVVYHFIGWRWPDYTKYHVASMAFNGADAVSFFFVLSGFVLSYKYFRSDRDIKMGNYIYRRVLRLYPAFIFTVLINYLYWNRASLMAGDYLPILKDALWHNGQQLWQELAMVRLTHKFYIPGWTLGVEMALSLLVPLMVYAARQNIKMIWWLIPIQIDMFHYTGIASALILLYIINSEKAQKFLTNGLWLFLGKISYSVYLAHWMMVVYVMENWDQLMAYFSNYYVGFGVLLVAVILSTVLLATFMYYCIEKPFINLARKYQLFT